MKTHQPSHSHSRTTPRKKRCADVVRMSRATSCTTADGQNTTSYQYDSAARLAARKVQADSQADLITQRYGYDSVERLAQIKYLKAEGPLRRLWPQNSEQHQPGRPDCADGAVPV